LVIVTTHLYAKMTMEMLGEALLAETVSLVAFLPS